jgi:hypothetical protein
VGTCVYFERGQDLLNQCGVYQCDGFGYCLGECDYHADCNSTHYCLTGQCVIKKKDGAPCTSHSECTQGYCVPGRSGGVCDQSRGQVASGKIAFCSAPGGLGGQVPWFSGLLIVGLLFWFRRRRGVR